MATLKSNKTTYEFSLDDMRALIANDLGVDLNKVTVTYAMGQTGPGDPMDRYPAPRGVVGVLVTVDNSENC
jgi:hypothetical protein